MDKRRFNQYINREQRILSALVMMQGRVEIHPQKDQQVLLKDVEAEKGLFDDEVEQFEARWTELNKTETTLSQVA